MLDMTADMAAGDGSDVTVSYADRKVYYPADSIIEVPVISFYDGFKAWCVRNECEQTHAVLDPDSYIVDAASYGVRVSEFIHANMDPGDVGYQSGYTYYDYCAWLAPVSAHDTCA